MRRALPVLLSVGLGLVAADAHALRRAAPHPAKPDRFPAVLLFGANVGESLLYRPRDERGRARRDAGRALEHLLRCRQNGARHRLHPRLGAALYEIGRHYAGHRIEIFSGYRPRAYCDRAHSRHMSGSAIDFHVEGVGNDALIAYLRKTFHPAGVGFYPHGVHVHLDVERDVDTYWVEAAPAPTVLEGVAAPPARDTAPEVPEPEEPLGVVTAPSATSLGEPPADDPAIADDSARPEDPGIER